MVSGVLMYSNFHRMASSKDCLIKAICGSFKPEEVQYAKDMLWNKFGDCDILKEHIDKRNSPNCIEIIAMSEDTIDALHDLEENEIDVICYAVNWHRIPKVKTEAISDLSVAKKLAEIEAKFKLYDNTLSEFKKHCLPAQNVQRVWGQHTSILKMFYLLHIVYVIVCLDGWWKCISQR